MQSSPDRLALVPVRLVVGGGLVYHGAAKFPARGHENIVSMLKQMGVPQPELSGWAVAALEFFGGLALVVGWRVKLVSEIILAEVVINLLSAMARGGFPEPLPGGQPLPGVESSFFYGSGTLSLILSEKGWDGSNGASPRRSLRPGVQVLRALGCASRR